MKRHFCSTEDLPPVLACGPLGRALARETGTGSAIFSRTPLRMSLVGGGGELLVFSRRFGGAVVSTAINPFVHVTVNQKSDEQIRGSHSRSEEARSVERVRHPWVRKAMRRRVDWAPQLRRELPPNRVAAFGESIHETWLLRWAWAGRLSAG